MLKSGNRVSVSEDGEVRYGVAVEPLGLTDQLTVLWRVLFDGSTEAVPVPQARITVESEQPE